MPLIDGTHYFINPTIHKSVAIKLTNKTGAATVKGTIVAASTGTDNAFMLAPGDSNAAIGVVYENGIADGSEAMVIVSGIAEVLLENSTAATRGYWVRTSTTVAGRADATNATPASGDPYRCGIGHCIESKIAGTDVLAKCVIHFN